MKKLILARAALAVPEADLCRYARSAPKWPGFTPPRSPKMPPLRGLLLLRRVRIKRAPIQNRRLQHQLNAA
jgi:hypothetical protein